MTQHQVNSLVEVEDGDAAWLYIRDFASDWHPDIVTITPSVDASGAIVREFTGSDGSLYREQRTYFSDTDNLLRYAMTSGIDGVEAYSGEASVLNNTVNWSCSFSANNKIGIQAARNEETKSNQG